MSCTAAVVDSRDVVASRMVRRQIGTSRVVVQLVMYATIEGGGDQSAMLTFVAGSVTRSSRARGRIGRGNCTRVWESRSGTVNLP